MTVRHSFRFSVAGRPPHRWSWLLAAFGALPAAVAAQTLSPGPARPRPVPQADAAPRIIVTPSAKPLPAAQLEDALRQLLKADSVARRTVRSGAESQGLVLDQTFSKIGHDFYDLFYGAFEPPPGSADFTLLVGERPGRSNTSLLVLTLNDQELLETPLPVPFDQQQELAAQAVEIARGFLAELQNVSHQLEAGRHAAREEY